MAELANSPVVSVPAVEEHVHSNEAEHESPTENRKLAMWLFLASECMFFAVLIAAYIYARFKFPDEHAILNIPLTSLNTFLLLTSSFTVVRALAAIEIGDRKKFVRSLALTAILGMTFLMVQGFEYSNLAREGLTLSSNLFGMAFFTLTGFHGAHVLIGVVWLLITFFRAFNGGFSKQDHFDVEFFGLYWHFVDVVWIIIFSVVYLI
jgi:heme/copper-type cytochrome/quinol oxidase subunit 3